jgi:hypothetical protein
LEVIVSRIHSIQLHRPIDQAARRGGWLLVGGFSAFVPFVGTIIATRGEADRAAQDAADRLGVSLAELPAEVLAPINNKYVGMASEALLVCLVLLSLGLFVAGVRTLGRISAADSRPIAMAAVILAALAPLCWLGIMALEIGISLDDPDRRVLNWYDSFNNPLLAASSVAASLALICLALVVRRARRARRTSVVVIALSAVVVIGAVVVGAPPILPLLLGAVLGLATIRSTRASAVA